MDDFRYFMRFTKKLGISCAGSRDDTNGAYDGGIDIRFQGTPAQIRRAVYAVQIECEIAIKEIDRHINANTQEGQ